MVAGHENVDHPKPGQVGAIASWLDSPMNFAAEDFHLPGPAPAQVPAAGLPPTTAEDFLGRNGLACNRMPATYNMAYRTVCSAKMISGGCAAARSKSRTAGRSMVTRSQKQERRSFPVRLVRWFRRHRDRRLIADSGVFDIDFYQAQAPDDMPGDPILHYLTVGVEQGLNPNSWFDTRYYVDTNADIRYTDTNPLVHYLQYGRHEGRSPSVNRVSPPDIGDLQPGNPAWRCAFAASRVVRLLVRSARVFVRTLGFLPEAIQYAEWCRKYDSITTADIAAMKADAAGFASQPVISIILPTYNTPPKYLQRAIQSVKDQAYERWELCIADDASTDHRVLRMLAEAAAGDARIKLVEREQNGHISAASNSALKLATGEYVTFLDHDDELRPHALYCVVRELQDHPDAALIYSDEDKISAAGRVFDPYFKPDWNPELFLAQNYLCHLSVFRRELVDQVGGLRLGLEGAQDWDLAMRVVERIKPEQIRHIPRVLYHWRAWEESTAADHRVKKYAFDAAQRMLEEHFERLGQTAGVRCVLPFFHIEYPVPDPAPSVTLIIPTRNHLKELKRCLDSIEANTDYPVYEILVVDNGSDCPETLTYLRQLESNGKARVLHYDAPFNFSAINNAAVSNVESDLVGFLNNDLEVISRGWLCEMAALAVREDVGAVGAKLYFADGTLQHGGVVLGIHGCAEHWNKHAPGDAPGLGGQAWLRRNVSAVTAACLLMRRELYLDVGGLDAENLAIGMNDVDFCLRLRDRGRLNIWTPHAQLYHYESLSRGYDDTPEKISRLRREIEFLREKWGEKLETDPYYNPNLSISRADLSLAEPPRVSCPWKSEIIDVH